MTKDSPVARPHGGGTSSNKRALPLVFATLLIVGMFAQPAPADGLRNGGEPASVADLMAAAEARSADQSHSWLPMDDPAETVDADNAWEPIADGRVPNMLQLFSATPARAAAHARLASTIVRGGKLDPTLKQAVGLRVAMTVGSPYVGAHMRRGLTASDHGNALLTALETGDKTALDAADASALRFAGALSQGPTFLTDEIFAAADRHFDDAELIELTMVVCSFDYFSRLTEAAMLPVEPWALNSDGAAPITRDATDDLTPRVALLLGTEAEAVEQMLAQRRDPEVIAREAKSAMRNTGSDVPNSLKAMVRVPDLAAAWRGASFGASYQSGVSEILMNYVSDAVSVQNECFYCQTHQLHKLSNLGVSVDQMALARVSDDALPMKERLAVNVARAATTNPISTNGKDLAALRDAFGDEGALDLIVQACRFNYMNRFTGGLRLPPESNPRHIYDEVVAREKELRISSAE